MVNIRYIFKRMKSSSFRYFVDTAKRIGKNTHKPWGLVLIDIVFCTLKYGSGHVDYETFKMYNMNKKERENLLTVGKNNKLFKALNDLSEIGVFEDKAEFNKQFSEFLHRDWFYIEDFKNVDMEKFSRFLEGKAKIIAKPLDLCCGKGIHMVDVENYEKLEDLLTYLETEGTPLVEEVVSQCEEMAAFCSTSINTVRVITIVNGNETKLVAGCMRTGREGSVVDNFNSNGLASILDTRTGTIVTDGYDKMRTLYPTHPETGVPFKGFKIPEWDKVHDFLDRAAKKYPKVRYVGWDICIDKNHNLLLIEGNSFPGQDVSQYPELNLGTYQVMMDACK